VRGKRRKEMTSLQVLERGKKRIGSGPVGLSSIKKKQRARNKKAISEKSKRFLAEGKNVPGNRGGRRSGERIGRQKKK